MTRGKFTKGLHSAVHMPSGWVVHNGDFTIASFPFSDFRYEQSKEFANFIAAAFNAATAAEDLGYDGQRAIEELPRLLGAVQTALNALLPQARYQDVDEYRQLAIKESETVLTACRVKEPSDGG